MIVSNVRLLPTEKAIRANVLRYLLHRTDYLNKPLFGRLRTVKELTEIAIRYVMEGCALHIGSDGRIRAEKKGGRRSPRDADHAAQS